MSLTKLISGKSIQFAVMFYVRPSEKNTDTSRGKKISGSGREVLKIW